MIRRGTTYGTGSRGLDDLFTRIGEEFGSQVAGVISTVRTFSVVVADTDDKFAYVYLFEETDDLLSVPLTFMDVPGGMIKIYPSVGSSASVTFINGDENEPLFTGFSQIDKIEIKRGKTVLTWDIVPPERDENGDEIPGTDTQDKLNLVIGNSTLNIDTDLFEFNGGSNKGMVITPKLTQRLNKMQNEINQIQNAIASHSHTVATTGSASAQTGNTTGTIYTRVNLTNVQDSDYENPKITQ